jgi:sulfhydrogenase subunit beta (sulfur reductase)
MILKKADINKFITEVIKNGFRVYGPVKQEDDVSFSEFKGADDISFDYFNFTLPPKRHFFPFSEPICTYKDKTVSQTPLPEEKAMIFGIRPCDARSFSFLDSVFIDEKAVDPYYRNRRDNTIVVSLACNEPLPTCFCTSVGGSPAGKEGTDILAFDTGDSLFFKSCSEKGKSFLESYTKLLSKPGQADIKAAEDLAAAAEKKVSPVNIKKAAQKLKEKFYNPVWDELALRCLGCGVCTFLCPTCYCFGLYDERDKRIRVQDSCMYREFTLEASGHNPRTTQNERMRQRVMHKFLYTVENFGETFCVGCGRCVTNCPVNMDIRENIVEVIG